MKGQGHYILGTLLSPVFIKISEQEISPNWPTISRYLFYTNMEQVLFYNFEFRALVRAFRPK